MDSFKHLFIYLAALGLSCGTQDLYCIMQDFSLGHVGPAAVPWGLQVLPSLVSSLPLAHSAAVPGGTSLPTLAPFYRLRLLS